MPRKAKESKPRSHLHWLITQLTDADLYYAIGACRGLLKAHEDQRKRMAEQGYVELPPHSELGKPMPEVPTASQGESNVEPH